MRENDVPETLALSLSSSDVPKRHIIGKKKRTGKCLQLGGSVLNLPPGGQGLCTA